MTDTLLEVDDLHVAFETRNGLVHAVNGNSFAVERGGCLAILGESGSGKSVTAQAIMGILPRGISKIPTGQIRFDGQDILQLSEKERVAIRGERIAMIFQDSLSALNPVYKIGTQISEVYRRRAGVSKKEARKRALEMMDMVRIPDPASRIDHYPHQFSGGMRQRIMIASALVLDPDLLIADEPTTALDVTVQAEIMELLAEIRAERNMSMLLITHDMGVVAESADDVVVMYAGKVAEKGSADDVFCEPEHPYTQGLLESIPKMVKPEGRQFYIPGAPPTLLSKPQGCPFSPRCSKAQDICHSDDPALLTVAGTHESACHFSSNRMEVAR